MTVTDAIERLREIARECDTLAFELQHKGGDAIEADAARGESRHRNDAVVEMQEKGGDANGTVHRSVRGKTIERAAKDCVDGPAEPDAQARPLSASSTPGRSGAGPPKNEWSAFQEFHRWWLTQGGGWNEQMAAQVWISKGFTDPEAYRKLKASWPTWEGHVSTWQAHNWLAQWSPENRPPSPLPAKRNGRAETITADQLRAKGYCPHCCRLNRYCECDGKVAG